MPPAVAPLNYIYISSGILWRIFFAKLEFSRGFLSFADRISAAAMPGKLYFLASLVQWDISRVILKIKASVVQWKDLRPWQREFEPEEKHFVSGNFAGFSLCISSEGSAKLRWVGRVAHLG